MLMLTYSLSSDLEYSWTPAPKKNLNLQTLTPTLAFKQSFWEQVDSYSESNNSTLQPLTKCDKLVRDSPLLLSRSTPLEPSTQGRLRQKSTTSTAYVRSACTRHDLIAVGEGCNCCQPARIAQRISLLPAECAIAISSVRISGKLAGGRALLETVPKLRLFCAQVKHSFPSVGVLRTRGRAPSN